MKTPLPRALALVAALSLVAFGCPNNSSPDVADIGGDAPIAADGSDANDTPAVDVPPLPDVPPVPRCGPSAEAYLDDAGACSVAMPVPDGGIAPPGQCVATVQPVGLLTTNALDGDAVVLTNGRRIQRAASRLGLSGFPMAILRIPGTSLIVVTDGGQATERLRVIDTALSPPAVVSGGEVTYPTDASSRQPALFYGLAYDPASHVLYASGGGSNRIIAFDVATGGALTANPARSIDLGVVEGSMTGHTGTMLNSAYPSGLALSPDGSQLYAGLQRGNALAIYSTATPANPRFVWIDQSSSDRPPYPYAVITRPHDPVHVYVSLWGAWQIAEIDVNAGTVTRRFDVGKNPEEILFSDDGLQLYVAASDSDTINVVDLSMPTARVRTAYLGGAMTAPRGISPSALAWGPMHRLYVVEAEENVIDVLDGTTLARVGRIPTEWYPTDVDVAPDGTVIVATGKGIGSGANNTPDTEGLDTLMQGSIARYPAPSDTALAAGDTTATYDNTVMSTFNGVSCPSGAAYDFPIPRVGDTNASSRIRRVIFVIRENKTYDAVLGDYPGMANTANGDPTLTLFPRDQMPIVYANLRALVRQFGNADNYYSNAEASLQGHVRTAHGRSTEYTERSWLTTWGRATRSPPSQGVIPVGQAEEGTIFPALERAHVTAENWGEAACDASPAQSVGFRYPGLFFNMDIPDMTKARAFADWIQGTNSYRMNPTRVCRIPSFTYILLPNDHTHGGSPGALSPQSFVEDNDEATGFLIDAISHSPFWPETLVVVIEDDPSDGGDHVDGHRSLALLASPWVRRGYTSHVHYDESSVHHTIELILGVPPHNEDVAVSAPMYDLFTSTPDFTPYRYIPRHDCDVRNPLNGRFAVESNGMDFSQPDNAPGLNRLLWRMLHNGQSAPWRAAPEPDDDDDIAPSRVGSRAR